MRAALDTNRYVDLCKGVDDTIEILEQAEEILMPFVVLGELRAGLHTAGERRRTSVCSGDVC